MLDFVQNPAENACSSPSTTASTSGHEQTSSTVRTRIRGGPLGAAASKSSVYSGKINSAGSAMLLAVFALTRCALLCACVYPREGSKFSRP